MTSLSTRNLRFAAAFVLTALAAAVALPTDPAKAQQANDEYSTSELVNTGHRFFGRISQGLATVVERAVSQLNQPATQRQLRYVQAIAREAGLAEEDLRREVQEMCGGSLDDLSRRDASALIERLQSRETGRELAS